MHSKHLILLFINLVKNKVYKVEARDKSRREHNIVYKRALGVIF